MTWLLILVVLAAAFAPVAYMMPSKRDRALADLRMIARREGLEVDVTRLPKLDAEPYERVSPSGQTLEPTVDCVSYGLRLSTRQLAPVRYRLLRVEHSDYAVLPGVAWELDRSFKPATAPVPLPDYWAVLPPLEAMLPHDVLALAITDDFVLVYWRERLAKEAAARGGQGRDSAALVADLRKLLNQIAQYHEKYFAPPAPETDA